MKLLTRFKLTYDIRYVAIEMIASYGMAVGASVFDTCVWIGRFKEHCLTLLWEVGQQLKWLTFTSAIGLVRKFLLNMSS